jgi:DNA-directed RNA polymerase specialized sigma24 family protein
MHILDFKKNLNPHSEIQNPKSKMFSLTRLPYLSEQEWYEGLRREESKAITYLSRKIEGKVMSDCRQRGLSGMEDEVLNEVLLRVIQQIRNGKYVYQQNTSPSTYALSLTHFIYLEFINLKQKEAAKPTSYEEVPFQMEDDVANTRQLREEVDHWLSLLAAEGGEDCATLIRKVRLENYSYKEILSFNWVAGYTTERSLATKANNCWNLLMRKIRNQS